MKKSILFGVLILCGSVPSLHAQAISSWVSMGTCHLQYKLDTNGNKVMDYSYAGYKGGGVALPTVPVAITVTPVAGDNTANIQAAINTVSAMPLDAQGFRGAVLLEPGTYNVSARININASGVVLRGSGSGTGGTILNMTGATFLLFSVAGTGSWAYTGGTATMTDAYVPEGANSFNVNSSAGFAVGDTVLVRRLVTQAWIDFMGMNTLVRNGAAQTWISAGTLIRTDRVITAINGNKITLDVPLTDSFDSNYTTGTMVRYTYAGRISQSGLEHFRITAPAQDNSNLGTQYQAFTMDALIDGWAQDIVVNDTDNSISVAENCKRVTLRNVSVNHSMAYTYSAKPEDFVGSGTQILFDTCASNNNSGVWAFSAMGPSTGPIVLLNCHSDHTGFEPHMRWATGLLADSCSFLGGSGPSDQSSVAYSNRGCDGSGHGWDTGWGVAWNVNGANFLVQEPPGVNNWCIGCIGTEISATPPCGSTVMPNGIYDSLGTHVSLGSLGNSLYLAQLADRQSGGCASSTVTATKTNTATFTATRTNTKSPTATFTSTFTNTPIPPTFTPTFTFSPTRTSTATSTSTNTPVPPTATFTRTVTSTPTKTLTSTATNSFTVTSTFTPTPSRTPTLTFTSTRTATPAPPLSFEAESAALSGSAVAASDSSASGGKKVRFIGGGTANFVTFNNVTVPTVGNYQVTVQCMVSGTRVFDISVNGGTAIPVTATGTSWSAPAVIKITLSLKAGTNSLKFFNNTAFAPDLDRIVVNQTLAMAVRPLAPLSGGEGQPAAPVVPLASRQDDLVKAEPNISRDGSPIRFHIQLDKAGQVRLALFTVLGESIYQASVPGNSGDNFLTWDLKNRAGQKVASGIYIYVIQIEHGTSVATWEGKVAVLH